MALTYVIVVAYEVIVVRVMMALSGIGEKEAASVDLVTKFGSVFVGGGRVDGLSAVLDLCLVVRILWVVVVAGGGGGRLTVTVVVMSEADSGVAVDKPGPKVAVRPSVDPRDGCVVLVVLAEFVAPVSGEGFAVTV